MFPVLTQFLNSGQQTIRAARYIGQGFMITLSHANRLPITIQYPYEKLITSDRFRGRIHFEFDKCIACEVCVTGSSGNIRTHIFPPWRSFRVIAHRPASICLDVIQAGSSA